MNLIEENNFTIKSLKQIIESFEMSIEKLSKLPQTKKRKLQIKEYESLIEYRKDKIRTLEIEIELEEIKEARINAQWDPNYRNKTDRDWN